MLMMLLPTALPTALPGAPASAACALVTSSGIEVPKPINVKPITSGDIPNYCASATAPRTSNSTPRIRPINLPAIP